MRGSFEIRIVFYRFFFFCICYYYIILIIIVLYFIASWRWFLIFTNPESTFFGLSSLEFFIESLYTSYYIYIKFFFLLPFFIFIYAYICLFVCFHVYRPCWKTCKISLWSESLVLYLYFRNFYFCVVELRVFVNVKFRKKMTINNKSACKFEV